MVENTQPPLARQQSTVPTACTNVESCILNVPITKAWEKFCEFKFNELCPNVVASVEWTSGKPMELGAICTITYK